jgi:hypothetical protein
MDIFYTDQGFLPGDHNEINLRDNEFAQDKFMHFIQQTQERNVFIYR